MPALKIRVTTTKLARNAISANIISKVGALYEQSMDEFGVRSIEVLQRYAPSASGLLKESFRYTKTGSFQSGRQGIIISNKQRYEADVRSGNYRQKPPPVYGAGAARHGGLTLLDWVLLKRLKPVSGRLGFRGRKRFKFSTNPTQQALQIAFAISKAIGRRVRQPNPYAYRAYNAEIKNLIVEIINTNIRGFRGAPALRAATAVTGISRRGR